MSLLVEVALIYLLEISRDKALLSPYVCSSGPVRMLRWSDPQSDYINTIWLEDCQALRHNVAKNIIVCHFHLEMQSI